MEEKRRTDRPENDLFLKRRTHSVLHSSRNTSDNEEREHEEVFRFKDLFETMSLGVVYQDSKGRIIAANPAAEKILGVTLDQMMGRTSMDPEWNAISEDGRTLDGHAHPAMIALGSGKRVTGFTMGVLNPAVNEIRWILVDATPVFKPGLKKPYQVYTTFRDITNRILSQRELQRSQNELEIYASLLQHDFGNDLQIIISQIELAEALLKPKTGEIMVFESIKAIAQRMVQLLKSIQTPSDEQHENLESMISRISSLSEKAHPGLVIDIDVRDKMAGNKSTKGMRLLPTVFDNLFRNAVEHVGTPVCIEVNVWSESDCIFIEVGDNGPGIHESIHPMLFQRGSSTTDRGLGLYLTSAILRAYNGTIQLHEMKNVKGACFLIKMPL